MIQTVIQIDVIKEIVGIRGIGKMKNNALSIRYERGRSIIEI
jgi:hypothetical protein